ncbi:trafficking protein particle complex II-specific subunit 120 homolog [Diospyros lotus]|uniref:trafficking protein particle complex II-specific subunit 120 homolog n=1 Tax=Diospyros lotus TaxID=55363 RepID=UPI00224D6BEA|nr:trafficking protein particle complex II-specific subunit 120 homolog [Diospyros lotus]
MLSKGLKTIQLLEEMMYLRRRELAKEVVELLTAAAGGAKSLIDAGDRLILYVEIARLFRNLGYHRKATFFSRQVAQLYFQQENREAATRAMQVLAMMTEAYRVQSRASIPKSSHPKWSTLQMVVLREILLSAVRAGDPLAAWSATARLLRSYYPLITPAGQNGLASALANSAERLP